MFGIDISIILILLALGLLAGILAGMLGIGGGTVMVPVLVWLLVHKGMPHEIAIKASIATSMCCIVFIAISNTFAHYRRGTVRWDVVKSFSPGIIIGSLICSVGVFALLKGELLAAIFALFMMFTAYQMARKGSSVSTGARELPGMVGKSFLGGTIGFVSGLFGAGGGFVTVPLLTYFKVPVLNAISTSAAISLPVASINTIGYVYSGWHAASALPMSLGYVWLPAVVLVSIASVVSTPLGVRLVHNMPQTVLKNFFAGYLCLMAAYMLYESGFWRFQ